MHSSRRPESRISEDGILRASGGHRNAAAKMFDALIKDGSLTQQVGERRARHCCFTSGAMHPTLAIASHRFRMPTFQYAAVVDATKWLGKPSTLLGVRGIAPRSAKQKPR